MPQLDNELLVEQAKTLLTLFGPRASAAQDEHYALSQCHICNPAPKVYRCYICSLATEARWFYRMHVKFPPEYCRESGEKWANRYAEMNT